VDAAPGICASIHIPVQVADICVIQARTLLVVSCARAPVRKSLIEDLYACASACESVCVSVSVSVRVDVYVCACALGHV
jgi:hypothetical protein